MSGKIAIIGWGSLIWDPRNLKVTSDRWFSDGPRLPLEFARKSKDGRITIVLFDQYLTDPSKWMKTYWNYIEVGSLEEAVQDLREREATIVQNIGYIHEDKTRVRNMRIADTIRKWIQNKSLIGVVWTDLSSNIGIDNILPHLESLKDESLSKAKDYIIRAPLQIKTPLRGKIQKTFGWMPGAKY